MGLDEVFARLTNVDGLLSNLNPAQRRRLYCLFVALDEGRAKEALAVAAEMETFISGDQTRHSTSLETCAGNGTRPPHRPTARAAMNAGMGEKQDLPPGETAEACSVVGNEHRPTQNASISNPRLDRTRQADFLTAIASGADNQELARRFGLTPRQANGLRLGFARRKHQNHTPQLDQGSQRNEDEPAEEEQKRAFLERKESPPDTIDDVIRFLRQLGDVIIRQQDGFLLNSREHLTEGQLVERANRRRIERGKGTFKLSPNLGQGPPDFRLPANSTG